MNSLNSLRNALIMFNKLLYRYNCSIRENMKKDIVTLREIMGLEVRQEALFYSLVIEGYVAFFLSKYLGIASGADTKCFSNRSSALSVYQKVNLFLDLGVIAKEEHWLFISFMEIRNQFMHNPEASSYEKCFDFVDGENKLLKRFELNEDIPREEKLKIACKKLFDELCMILDKIEDSVVDRLSTLRNTGLHTNDLDTTELDENMIKPQA